jgi:DNA repair protein RecN (Recombination protein N)
VVSDRSHLEEISIRGLGIIDQSILEFSTGLNVLTGETGAGKTMILTALNLVLGGKSDSALIRHGSERLVTSAQFSLSSMLTEIATNAGADVEDGTLILTRSVNPDGKSKAVAGGTPVPASTLSTLADHLVEIHGQSANHQIVKPARQRELLDRFGGETVKASLDEYSRKFSVYGDLKERIVAMKTSASKRGSEVAALEEFVQEWNKLKVVRGEYSSTQEELTKLSSVEELRVATTGASSEIESEGGGARSNLNQARKFLDSVKGKDPSLDQIAMTLSESYFLLDDASRDLASYVARLEADPERVNVLHERLAQIKIFLKRWGGPLSPDENLLELSGKAKNAKAMIEDLQGGDSRIEELEKELQLAKKDLLKAASGLSLARKVAAKNLSAKVTTEIHSLSMPHTTFIITVNSPDYNGLLKESDFTSFGCDEILMQIQSHIDGPLVALGKGASGGEMSRIMLALEVVLAQSFPVGTYIFDEVDAGVGGKAAIEVGRRLHELAKHTQVIVVTHLPQVAAWAQTHFVVRKNSDGSVTQSDVEKLDGQGRIEEIARMLAGLEESASAREHAAELLALRG